MGKNHSKNNFSQWDLDRFSNVTGIPRDTVNRLYQEFIASTGKDNQMDKKEFRRLYKEFYLVEQPDATGPTALSDHELNKIADRVFKAFDRNGTGKLTFEEFVNAYLLLNRSSSNTTVTARDRLNYILDQNNPTPGFISRESGEQIFNDLSRYYIGEDTSNTTTTTTIPAGATKPVTTTWEQHWTKLDDGTGRVPQEKFVEYITTSDDYKNNFDRALH
jgi:hypothetical protein